jgi:hypothetical protein
MPPAKLPLGRLGLFVALSAADLGLTLFLIGRTEGVVYEGNPVAGWWLDRHGWLGLAAFKGAVVGLVGVLTVVLARQRPRAAGRLVGFGCAAVGVVVLYGCSLARAYVTGGGDEAAEIRASAASNDHLEAEIEKGTRYRTLLRDLGEELSAGRMDLAVAVARLRQTERGRDPGWLALLRANDGGLGDEECLAANLIIFAVPAQEADPPAALAVRDRLAAEFRPPARPERLDTEGFRETHCRDICPVVTVRHLLPSGGGYRTSDDARVAGEKVPLHRRGTRREFAEKNNVPIGAAAGM